MTRGPGIGGNAIGIEECIASLSAEERSFLAGLAGTEPGAGVPEIAACLLDRLDHGSIHRPPGLAAVQDERGGDPLVRLPLPTSGSWRGRPAFREAPGREARVRDRPDRAPWSSGRRRIIIVARTFARSPAIRREVFP